MTPRSALFVLILISTALRLAWASALDLGNDEAYYLQYAQQADWSYVDHPPAVAIVASVGLRFEPWLGPRLGPRLGFVLLFSGSTWLMAWLGTRTGGAWAGVAAAFLLNVAGYFGLAAGAFVVPDGPLLFFWLTALNATLGAMRGGNSRRGGLRGWVVVGLACGGALLSKYHGVLLVAGIGCFLMMEPLARGWLRRPGPYLAAAVAVVMFAPVVGWNAAYGWSSFVFQGSRGLPESWMPRWDRLASAIVGQAIYVFPWVWLVLMAPLVRQGRGLADRFLMVQAVVPLAAVGLVACWRSTLPHWGLIGLVPLMPLAGAWMSRELAAGTTKRAGRRIAAWGLAPVILGGLAAVHERCGLVPVTLQSRLGLARLGDDPTLDTYGWDQIAREVWSRGLVGADRPAFVFTSKWYQSAQLARALGSEVPVLCYSARNPVGFSVWSGPADWVGRDGLMVVVDPCSTEPQAFDRWFERIEPRGEIEVERGGGGARRVRLYRCLRQVRPFPYAEARLWEIGREVVPESGRLAERRGEPLR